VRASACREIQTIARFVATMSALSERVRDIEVADQAVRASQ